MPKKPEARPVEDASPEEKLYPFSTFINGQDRTIFAKDAKDFEERLAKIRAQ